MTSSVMLAISFTIAVSSLFMIKTPHELGRQKKYQEMETVLEKIRDKSNTEIRGELELLKIQVSNEIDSMPFIQKLRNLNKKNVFVLWVVFAFFANMAGIQNMDRYLPEIFSDSNVPGSILVNCYGASHIIFSFLQMLIADKFDR